MNDEKIIATCMTGYDGHRGWIYFLAVSTPYQKLGVASRLVEHVETQLTLKGCPKVELMVRATNESVIGFYEGLGYRVEPVSILSKRLIKDDEHDFL